MWQFRQECSAARLLTDAREAPATLFRASYKVPGWRVLRWQRWQRNGCFATSIFSWLDPWGSWQVRQFSRTGACSHRKGPRFSVWHERHFSLTDSAEIIFGLVPSCGSWQLAQSRAPSRTGWWETRIPLARIWVWHVKQVSASREVLSWAFVEWKSWTLWQLTQDRPRRSWTPPPQLAWRALS